MRVEQCHVLLFGVLSFQREGGLTPGKPQQEGPRGHGTQIPSGWWASSSTGTPDSIFLPIRNEAATHTLASCVLCNITSIPKFGELLLFPSSVQQTRQGVNLGATEGSD